MSNTKSTLDAYAANLSAQQAAAALRALPAFYATQTERDNVAEILMESALTDRLGDLIPSIAEITRAWAYCEIDGDLNALVLAEYDRIKAAGR